MGQINNKTMQFSDSIPLCSLAAPTCSVACWTPASTDRAKMVFYLNTHAKLHLFVLALLPRVLHTTTTTSATPINTCCPPGHFLAIEDLQQSKQDPEGHWTPDHSNNRDPWHERWRRYEGLINKPTTTKIHFTESYMARKWCELIGLCSGDQRLETRLDRHHYISRVFCVPDKNDLPGIDGLSGASLPSPPYFATTEAWLQSELIESRVLAEGQVLRSKGLEATGEICFHFNFFLPGSRLPSCPAGPAELATIVLGNGGLEVQSRVPQMCR